MGTWIFVFRTKFRRVINLDEPGFCLFTLEPQIKALFGHFSRVGLLMYVSYAYYSAFVWSRVELHTNAQ